MADQFFLNLGPVLTTLHCCLFSKLQKIKSLAFGANPLLRQALGNVGNGHANPVPWREISNRKNSKSSANGSVLGQLMKTRGWGEMSGWKRYSCLCMHVCESVQCTLLLYIQLVFVVQNLDDLFGYFLKRRGQLFRAIFGLLFYN